MHHTKHSAVATIVDSHDIHSILYHCGNIHVFDKNKLRLAHFLPPPLPCFSHNL